MCGNGLTRRKFIGSAAAFSVAAISPSLVKGTTANSKINLGLIGCGKRGTWLAELFKAHGGYNVVAGADYFQDRVEQFSQKLGVEQNHLYTGLSGYKRLLDNEKLDAIAVVSPPYFHPAQAAAGVAAGLNVYVAKPVAVDVPGSLSIEKSGAQATANNLCFLVDFQTRANDFFREAVKRAQYGDIGKIFAGEASYHCNALSLKTEPGTQEARLRNWYFDKALSGDIITEQNIHVLDVASWILDDKPTGAWGTGGRMVRTNVGDCWDHFAVIFDFPGNIKLTFNSKQCGDGYSDLLCRMYGSKGTIETHYGGEVKIRGAKPYKGGETPTIYKDGAIRNVADFYDNITKKNYYNTTVAQSVRSNLTTIVGRAAAYQKKYVTWDEVIASAEKFDPKLDGFRS